MCRLIASFHPISKCPLAEICSGLNVKVTFMLSCAIQYDSQCHDLKAFSQCRLPSGVLVAMQDTSQKNSLKRLEVQYPAQSGPKTYNPSSDVVAK